MLAIAWEGTIQLIATRIPTLAKHPLVHIATGVGWVLAVASALFVGAYWAHLGLTRLFPPLERLPDSGQSRWDRARGWVQFATATWVAVIGVVVALPKR